jgi:glyoxylase-like metal-dependent hydrolase (beta-lactamase superfamily II)
MSLEVTSLTPRCRVVRGPANVGIISAEDDQSVLVDSGNDDDAGRKLLRACETRGSRITHIANTHSNADHCGGNAFIQARTDCAIWATKAEAAFIENPYLEPSYLWGGYPLPSLRNKFLMAKPSRVTRYIEPPCDLPGTGLKAVPLAGHFMAMAGFMTEDGVFFAADTIASQEILSKYHIFFLFDIEAQLSTLDSLASRDAEWYVPSHAEPTRDPTALIAANKAKIHEIAETIVELCAEPRSPEEVILKVASKYGIVLNHQQYVLVGSTLRSYLSWLVGKALLGSGLDGGRLVFTRL